MTRSRPMERRCWFPTVLLIGALLAGCASKTPTERKPNHVLIESNRAEAIPLAARYIKRKGYLAVPTRELAESVLTVSVSKEDKPYATPAWSSDEKKFLVPVSFRMVNRADRLIWQSCGAGQGDTEAEALGVAVRYGIEGSEKHNAGLSEIIKLPLDALMGLQRPTPLPFYKP